MTCLSDEEIKVMRELAERDSPRDPSGLRLATLGREDQLSAYVGRLLAEVDRLRKERDEARSNTEQMREERDAASIREQTVKGETWELSEELFRCATICQENHGILVAHGQADAVQVLSNRCLETQVNQAALVATVQDFIKMLRDGAMVRSADSLANDLERRLLDASGQKHVNH